MTQRKVDLILGQAIITAARELIVSMDKGDALDTGPLRNALDAFDKPNTPLEARLVKEAESQTKVDDNLYIEEDAHVSLTDAEESGWVQGWIWVQL